ncbi:hypothetical protein [uncultured Flavobacterium sp.]|uniref:hypothetical protein n=1 Tax=uncultured Flavobacterium sp. TaxID=165435 RepID=UPI0030EB3CA9|tara:strand:+ start:95911 stop:96333 length:423 start_codon:yes stop_codon:yes gene_type:complete
MLFNISHNDKKTKKTIIDLVGKPFGILDNLRLKGIGSPRLLIVKASQEIGTIVNKNNATKYASIELRPNGILIGFQSQLEVYVLVIPFYKLVVFKPGNLITFHIDHHFISIDASKNSQKTRAFMAKIENQKLKQPYEFIN